MKENNKIELKMRHLFDIAEIINKMGLTDELDEFLSSVDVSELTEEELIKNNKSTFADVLKIGMKGLPKVRYEVADLIADLKGITTEESLDLSFSEIKEVAMEIFANQDTLVFFTPAV